MPPQSRTRRLSSDGQATLRRLDDAELRRRDAQTEAILARLASPSGADRAPSLRDLLLPRSSEVAAPTDAQRAAHEARVRETQAGWGPVRRRMAQVAEYVPEFLGGALWGDPTAPGASRANLMGQMLTAGIPFASGIKGGLRTGRGLFSRLDDAIDLIPVKGAHPNKVASLLSRASKEELEYRGVPAFLAAQGNTPVTREALRAHLGAHPAPFPGVTTRGRDTSYIRRGRLERGEATPLPQEPKYSQYQVPGGTNYRETVLTLPNDTTNRMIAIRGELETLYKDPAYVQPRLDAGLTFIRDSSRRADAAQLQRRIEALGAEADSLKGAGFYSQHFDEPNVLVHTRSNERTLPTGERGRFLEEVQSDWHQAGKAKGYQSDTPRLQWDKASDTLYEANTVDGQLWVERQDDGWFGGVEGSVYTAPHATREAAEAELMSTMRDNFHQATFPEGVPDAPFKDSWPDLVFKQQLLEVADDPTLDWIGWTSGKTQAARYKQITKMNEVHYSGSDLVAYDHAGTAVIQRTGVGPEDLPRLIGKEAAERLLAQPRRGTLRSLIGQKLEVGGEGMVEFYDRLLPKRVAKIVKPFGGTVERVRLRKGQPYQWVVRLTPEMKAKIKQGLPLLALPAGIQISASRPEED
jgi:hypothetical protein